MPATRHRLPVAVQAGDIVRAGLCIGCGGCASMTDGARMEMDRYGLYRPVDHATTSAFDRICPFSPNAANEDVIAAEIFGDAQHAHPATGRFRSAYVGHVAEGEFRANGSSGGMVSWVLQELLRRGLVDGVAHVAPGSPLEGEPFFEYRISRTAEEIDAGAKSRYYPVEMSHVLREIRSVPGRYAVVGVPCFIKAVQLQRRQDPVLDQRIAFTLALFCGHMKSARFVDSFARQMDVPIEEVAAVQFRRKDPSRPASTYTAEITLATGDTRVRDWWNLVDGDWGAGFFQSSACNYCDDVVGETADISFGDAWVEPYSSDGWGTNVLVIRSPVVDDIVREAISDGRLSLEDVDGDFVEATQAAGLRQRREGLAYRLTWRTTTKIPKRVTPARPPSLRRRFIYRTRFAISAWSHRTFWLAERLDRPTIYTRWARAAVAAYHGLAYSRGRIGAAVDRLRLR